MDPSNAALHAPANAFKRQLYSGQPQIGLWAGLADAYVTELLATAGFHWLLVDAEHAPNDLRSILGQLQAIAPYASAAVVRPPVGETWMIKRLLDIGAQSLLIPMVESAAQAEALVAATRFPPHGVRGVGLALARASAFNARTRYMDSASAEICLLVQVESALGLENIEAIAKVDGIDGIFIGPADLAASLGHPGNPAHPDVQGTIDDALRRIQAAGNRAGILTSDNKLAQHYLDLGASFVAVGTDVTLLANAARTLAARFGCRPETAPAPAGPY
ncbi:MAG: 4-hydroxy-2-oxoheptanedioate aldolase [Pseudomonadota bacterium]|uniref:4-hydroxy-2-oxoheptanedioate aldolase n=1 Tax=Aquabacter cavernae TaxID=2496029 RepID=UPI000F8DBCCE|nr:4-hydroxy-2-oxoheptanedioate aldolase [Aquabacter cavernae]MBA4790221.1 4-hydroxy-2-oxoheptanedioate aldolase [Hyphomicrobiales bacterium]